jgi:hypothetical protein
VSSTTLGMALAFAAALALNGAYLMQHVGSSTTMAIDPRRPIATLSALLRSPLWTLGSLVGLSGWALHIGAMREAPLSLVQACVAGGLALAAPMAAIGLRRRLARSETQALAVMVIALVLLSLGLTAHRHAGFHAGALASCTALLAAAAVALAIRARGRPVVLGVAGGLLYGTADLAIKAVTGLPAQRILETPWLAAALIASGGAFFTFQRALQGDRPLAAIAAMTGATNLSSIAAAFVVFGDPLGRTPWLAAVHGLAFALVIAAALWLAPAQARLARSAPNPQPPLSLPQRRPQGAPRWWSHTDQPSEEDIRCTAPPRRRS